MASYDHALYKCHLVDPQLLSQEQHCILRQGNELTVMHQNHKSKGPMPLSKHTEMSSSLADEKICT